MALSDPHQANDFPGDQVFHPVQHQSHIQNAWVSLGHFTLYKCSNAHPSVSILLQVPPAPANGQPEGHRDIPPQARGVAGPGRVQAPYYFDVAYQDVVDYHPQPLPVSNLHLSAIDPPFDQ